MYNIVAKYCKRNSRSYLPKDDRPKTISNQQLQTLVNKTNVHEHRLARRFGTSPSVISRHLKKRASIRIDKRRSAPKYKNEDQQQQAKSSCTKTFSRLSADLG